MQRLEWFSAPASMSGLRVLELASHCGAIGLEFARRGAEVIGLERNGDCVDVANKLASACGLTASFRRFDADVDEFPTEAFDAVFCGSLDHWITRRDALYDAAARLAAKTCYFESNEITRHEYLDQFFSSKFKSEKSTQSDSRWPQAIRARKLTSRLNAGRRRLVVRTWSRPARDGYRGEARRSDL